MRYQGIYIGIGSNLFDPIYQVNKAIDTLNSLSTIHLLNQSSLYRTSPLGPQDQPDFINAVVEIETSMEPLELLDQLQAVEVEFGRVKDRRWGERVIDLDILLFGRLELEEPRLSIPHKGVAVRSFVLVPMCELDPDVYIPGLGEARLLINHFADASGSILEKITA